MNTNLNVVYNVYCKDNVCQIEADNTGYDEMISVCEESAKVIDGALEEECGRLQDNYYKGE